MRLLAVVIGFAFLLSSCQQPPPAATDLRVDASLVDPLGFHKSDPTFSWTLPAGEAVTQQTAYELQIGSAAGKADVFASGKTLSGQSVAVKVPTLHLRPRQKIFWRVKFWDQNDQASAWSDNATLETGLLENTDWQGQWIGAPAPQDTTEFGMPAFRPLYLRRTFSLADAPQNARLYVTAKGVFRAYLNGKRIGQDVMAPGWTPYHRRIETLTYDVTDLLQTGDNVLAVELAEGWYAGRIGYTAKLWRQYEPPRLLAQLEVASGVQVVTDQEWRYTDQGPRTFASIYDGVERTQTPAFVAWNQLDFPATDWQAVVSAPLDAAVALVPKQHPTVKNMAEQPTQSVTQKASRTAIFDLGQNLVGVPRLRLPLQAGDTLRVRFAEMLEADGELHTKNYRSARSTNYFVATADGPIDWTPTFTFHGFRYVELSGYPSDATPTADWVTGIVQHSDFRQRGTFTSSHAKLNQLQSNIEWGLRGNFLDIPTDCPQRDERLGWTGDAQVFAPTSLFLNHVDAFWASWLRSMREEQLPDGGIPIFIPDLGQERVSAGWGDAATIIPWELYWRTGDTTVLRDNYAMMRGWIDFYRQRAENHLANFWSFNDWLQPYAEDRRGDTPQELICTAFYARSVDLCGRSARVLGKDEEAREMALLFDSIAVAFRREFFDAAGRITRNRGTQTGYLLALGFGLLPESIVPRAKDRLLIEIDAADGHLRTGFLGTPLLAPVLDSLGHPEVVYDILFRETYPGWFYSINQGATTMWERWNSYTQEDGFNPEGMNSFNHYAYGAIGQWLYERVAGIRPRAAGYREIEFAPLPGGPLTSAAATYESPYGRIASSWSLEGGDMRLELTVPPGTTGRLTLPANYNRLRLHNGEEVTEVPEQLGPGVHRLLLR
ncbi:MAG: family 78 glycoside hydrolase catalytic domain [Bacteroidota bacterium]